MSQPIDITENEKAFLLALYEDTEGDVNRRRSMFAIGNQMGLEKSQASQLGENLIAQGWVEIKTLAGDIGITSDGIEIVNSLTGKTDQAKSSITLGSDIILSPDRILQMDQIIASIKSEISRMNLPYEQLSILIYDFRTYDVQAASPQPKTAILRAVLTSIRDQLDKAGGVAQADQLSSILLT